MSNRHKSDWHEMERAKQAALKDINDMNLWPVQRWLADILYKLAAWVQKATIQSQNNRNKHDDWNY